MAGLIQSSSPLPGGLAANTIYVRTVKGGVYQAVHRSLTQLWRQFGGPLFSIHQSLLINHNAAVDASLRLRKPEVGMWAGTSIDHLSVARQRVPPLKNLLFGDDFEA